MSQREQDRLKVLHEVQKGQLRQQQAAAQLGLTDRWVRKLLKRVRAVARVEETVRDFGPTLAREYLAKRDRLPLSKERLRKWLIEAGVRKARPRRVKEMHLWRPRRECHGELVQWDTSEHACWKGAARSLT